MRTYKPRNRGKLIEQANANSITHMIKSKDLTIEQKRAMVVEKNPFLHLLFLGGNNASNKAVPQTKQA